MNHSKKNSIVIENFNLVTAKNFGYIDNSNKIMLYNITNIQNDYDQIDEEEIDLEQKAQQRIYG